MNNYAEILTELKAVNFDVQVKEKIQKEFKFPSPLILEESTDSAEQCALEVSVLEKKLAEFGFTGKVENVSKGPMITRYEIRFAPGVRLSQIRNASEDLAIALMSDKIRIQAPIPGTSLVGFEVANSSFSTVGMRTIAKAAQNTNYVLPIGIGVDTTGKPKIVDLTKMPHLLIAGQTGSGKSVGVNVILTSLLYTKTPDELKLVLVDPKRVEMSSYKNLPHLYRPIVTEAADAVFVFNELVEEMERRYDLMEKAKVRNIVSYNDKMKIKLPYIVTVVDEMADLMMTSGKNIESYIVRLSQLARAVGIHLILATQKPIVKVITGLIKSNMPSRLSYQVGSKSDSRVILDINGAEKLLGRGDCLMITPGSGNPERYHGAWISDDEIEDVCSFIKGE